MLRLCELERLELREVASIMEHLKPASPASPASSGPRRPARHVDQTQVGVGKQHSSTPGGWIDARVDALLGPQGPGRRKIRRCEASKAFGEPVALRLAETGRPGGLI